LKLRPGQLLTLRLLKGINNTCKARYIYIYVYVYVYIYIYISKHICLYAYYFRWKKLDIDGVLPPRSDPPPLAPGRRYPCVRSPHYLLRLRYLTLLDHVCSLDIRTERDWQEFGTYSHTYLPTYPPTYLRTYVCMYIHV
jgi:hypothetical protein